jgi:hypothetical protein
MPANSDRPHYPDDETAFRDWLNDPEHDEPAQGLVADFLADEGIEMIFDLLACRGQQHQWAAERWMGRLRERFERWLADGRPRLAGNPRVRVSYDLDGQDQAARRLLQDNLPPTAAFTLSRRWRKVVGGTSEPAGCSCKIEDGAAVAAAQGDTPLAAAEKALAAWREFVTGSRVHLEEPVGGGVGEPAVDRPPLLNAPSTAVGDAAAATEQARRRKTS